LKQLLNSVLFSLSKVYELVITLRLFLYKKGILKSKKYSIPIICVGNISTGGTGKTPMAIYLLKLLEKNKLNAVLLSRGYKRKIKGIVFANNKHTSIEIGDEPKEILQHLPLQKMVLSNSRTLGVEAILKKFEDVDVVIMDDGFQHLQLRPSFSIINTKYSNPFTNDKLLPLGNLRESTKGLNRANLVVVNDCPTEIVSLEINDFNINDIHYTQLNYSRNLYSIFEEKKLEINSTNFPKIVVITGIVSNNSMVNFLSQHTQIISVISLKDHFNYSSTFIEKTINNFDYKTENLSFVFTQKDAVKIAELKLKLDISERMFYLPIEIEIKNKEIFNQKILNHVRTYKTNN
jgi:tetraacyldisaccharide 4'-kinase